LSIYFQILNPFFILMWLLCLFDKEIYKSFKNAANANFILKIFVDINNVVVILT